MIYLENSLSSSMVPKRKKQISLVVVALIGFFVLNLAFPQYSAKYINLALDKTPVLKLLPRFPERDFKLGLDLQGGSRLVYEADVSVVEKDERGEAMNGLRDVIERRVNLFGVGEPVVATQLVGQSQRLVVELPGVHDINQAIEMIGKTPYLEFQEQADGGADEEPFKPTGLTGKYLKKAALDFNQTTFVPEVILDFDDEGKKIFKELTEQNVGKQIAIFIDGILISAPRVTEVIPQGRARITGDFTVEEAKELSRNLNAGALPVPISLISQTTVGPTLGKISLERSLKAGIFGFLAVCLFMLVFYRLSGFLAAISLLIYAGIVLTLFKFVPVTLTLAGIGGAILSVGMAVDANVLIFERTKEERKAGESFQRAVETGFSRAWPSIRDSNITTLLVGFIMFSFGTSFVKGFALTLCLGILVSMFSALFITRTFLRAFVGTRWEKAKWLWR